MGDDKTTGIAIAFVLGLLVGVAVGFYVLPQYLYSEVEYKKRLSNLTTNLQSIRAQLELYRLHHKGAYPADIVGGLTSKTMSDGTISAAGPYGPYLSNFLENPFVDDPAEAVKTSGGPGEGWLYDPKTGALIANTPGHRGL
ncbi:MAG: hypothetical protein GY794_26375 [bacterium]|nr:hypothetical protein [bacterium]